MRPLIVILILAATACGDAQAPPRSFYDGQGGLVDPPESLRDHNVVLISIDTLRADHLGSYGYKVPTTPNIDAIARAGTVFAYATRRAAPGLPMVSRRFRVGLETKKGLFLMNSTPAG